MKKAWYLIKNIIMALAVAGIGSSMAADVNNIVLTLVGVYLIFAGCSSLKETDFKISMALIVIGVGLIALGQTVLKNNIISYYVSAVFIALIAIRQFVKVFDFYSHTKWKNLLLKAIALVYSVSLLAGTVFAVFMQNIASAATFYSMGTMLWILHAILVVRFDTVGKCVGAGKKTNTGNTNGGASESKVATEMKSLANYLTGGFDDLGYGVSIKYSVSVIVAGGEIKFTVSGSLSGTDNLKFETQVNSVKSALESATNRRASLIIKKAEDCLERIGTDRDYNISVVGGDIS